MPKILTVIVTYNGMTWLEQCLASVMNSTVPSDLFIVDNGSTDGSVEFIKEHYPDSNFIQSKENLGFGKANNLGLSYAVNNDYDYVYLLNQDAWIEPDTFEALIKISIQNPDMAILSPLQMNREKTKLDRNFAGYIPQEMISDYVAGQTPKEVYPASFVMAAHWLIPINTLKVVGGFSPIFPHYGEDNNFIDRCFSKNYKIGIVPKAVGVHDREYRATTIEKKKYLRYIHILTVLNNPLKRHKALTLLRYLIIYILRPHLFTPKLWWKSVKAYSESKRISKEYSKPYCFLEVVHQDSPISTRHPEG